MRDTADEYASVLVAFVAAAAEYCRVGEDWWAVPGDVQSLLMNLEPATAGVLAAAVQLPPTHVWYLNDEELDELEVPDRAHRERTVASDVLRAGLMKCLEVGLGDLDAQVPSI